MSASYRELPNKASVGLLSAVKAESLDSPFQKADLFIDFEYTQPPLAEM